jgi:hypothetical protein
MNSQYKNKSLEIGQKLEKEISLNSEKVLVQGLISIIADLEAVHFSGIKFGSDPRSELRKVQRQIATSGKNCVWNKDHHMMIKRKSQFKGNIPPYVLASNKYSLQSFVQRIFKVDKKTALNALGSMLSYLFKPGTLVASGLNVLVIKTSEKIDGDFYLRKTSNTEKFWKPNFFFQGFAIPTKEESNSIFVKGDCLTSHPINGEKIDQVAEKWEAKTGQTIDLVAPMNSTKFCEPGVYQVHLFGNHKVSNIEFLLNGNGEILEDKSQSIAPRMRMITEEQDLFEMADLIADQSCQPGKGKDTIAISLAVRERCSLTQKS